MNTSTAITEFDAILFDLDGVITDTAVLHAAAWKSMFDEFMRERSDASGEPFEPFSVDNDYRTFVDGKPRYDGVRSFLDSRSIEVPEGNPEDPPDRVTVQGLGNRKNALVVSLISDRGVDVYQDALVLIQWLSDRAIPMAIVSSSANARAALRSAAVIDLFAVIVDGVVSAELNLEGKPAPDAFLLAARQLGVAPEASMVVEDALAGVAAGKAGGFGIVVGVDRVGQGPELAAHGADIVVKDLSTLIPNLPT